MAEAQAHARGTASNLGPSYNHILQPETGQFFYKSGATYEGEFIITGGAAKQTATPEPPKKGAKPPVKKPEAEEAAVPAEPPKRVRHGTGVYSEGSYSYSGQWHMDSMHGTGKFTFQSGAFYEGGWQSNKYHGQGRYQWPDGRYYQGDWVEGKMHGQGTYVDVEGHRWEGQFYNGAGPGLTCRL